MENNNGRGIFYGVIGVATLIVAIIGATFAYFTATANSNVNAVTATGAKVSLKFDETPKLKSNLIPVRVDTLDFNKTVDSATPCVDKNTNNVCSVYEFTITNPSTTTAQEIFASLRVSNNTFEHDTNSGETNLKFAIYRGTAADVKASSQKVTDAVTATAATASNGTLMVSATPIEGQNEISLTALNEVLPATQSRTYTVVMWINETGEDQNKDQEKSFAGGIFFTTASGENTGITGVLSTTSE